MLFLSNYWKDLGHGTLHAKVHLMNAEKESDKKTPTPHQRIIRLFGPRAELARLFSEHLGKDVTGRMVQHWHNNGLIPSQHLQDVYDLSVIVGLGITPDDFFLPYPRVREETRQPASNTQK